ncbi:MAG: hypothetical protein ACRDWY_06045 [Actinomycetes bacterium]
MADQDQAAGNSAERAASGSAGRHGAEAPHTGADGRRVKLLQPVGDRPAAVEPSRSTTVRWWLLALAVSLAVYTVIAVALVRSIG